MSEFKKYLIVYLVGVFLMFGVSYNDTMKNDCDVLTEFDRYGCRFDQSQAPLTAAMKALYWPIVIAGHTAIWVTKW